MKQYCRYCAFCFQADENEFRCSNHPKGEEPHRMYSYCPDCIDKGIEALKEQDPIKPIVDIDTWACGKCGYILEKQELIGDNVLVSERFDFCPACGKKVDWDG